MLKRCSAIAVAVLACGISRGAPRYRLPEANGVREEVVEIPLHLTYEEPIRGFSFALGFDASALAYVGAGLGSATAPLGELFFAGSGAGQMPEGAVVGGCVFDALEPYHGQVLPPGIDLEIAIVRLRIRAAAPIAVAAVDLEEQPGPHGLPIPNLVSTLIGRDAFAELIPGAVRVLPRPALQFACERSSSAPTSVQLRWTNAEPDLAAVRIYRGGTLLETLPGSAQEYIDPAAGPGPVAYAVEPVGATGEGARRACSVGAVGIFVRGEINNDGQLDIADPIDALNFLFAGKEIDCWDAVDIDDSGVLNLADPILLLMYLFADGPPPAPPFPEPGADPTPDDPCGCDRV